MRIEVNRKVFEIESVRVTGAYLRGVVGVPDFEDLYGKGPARPDEKEARGGGGFLVEPDREFALNECREFFTVEKEPTIFAGIPIQFDETLGPNEIKLTTASGRDRIYRVEDGHLNDVTI